MTSPRERRQEFLQSCLSEEGGGRTKTVRIDGRADQKREAERFRNLAEYHRIAANDNLEGKAPLMAIRQGYYVMLHKANEALALAGFKANTHTCTLLGIRGIFDAPKLADSLRRASEERKVVDYQMDPSNPQLQHYSSASEFIENEMLPFIREINRLIDREELRD